MHLTSRQTRAVTIAFRILLTCFIVVAALLMANYVWHYYELTPQTRDGHIRADVIDVSTDVSGLLTEVSVHGNMPVKRGQLLFKVDPQRFEIALSKAQATLDSARAQLVYARQQASRNAALRGLVAQQNVDQSDNMLRAARAQVEQAEAGVASARLDLQRATVVAPVDGIVTNVTLHPGRFVAAGTGMLALIDTASLRVEGFFQETRLRGIHIGDRARVVLMGEKTPLYGHVTSIVGGINDSETATATNLLPQVDPNFAWVRLAQRVPVWITLDSVPDGTLLLSGRSATVDILSDRTGEDGRIVAPGTVTPEVAPTPGVAMPGTHPASDARRNDDPVITPPDASRAAPSASSTTNRTQAVQAASAGATP